MNTMFPAHVATGEVLFETDGFTIQLCCSEKSLKLAYALRHSSYLNANAIEEKRAGTFFDRFDHQANSRTHLIWHEGIPIASVRSCIWSKKYAYLPVESIESFPKDVAQHIGLDKNILESSRYVIAPGFNRRKSLFAQLLMFKIQDLSSIYDDCKHIITSVRERHTAFYKRMLAFDRISEPIAHDFINANIVLLKTSQEESRRIITEKGMPPSTEEEVRRYSELAKQLS